MTQGWLQDFQSSSAFTKKLLGPALHHWSVKTQCSAKVLRATFIAVFRLQIVINLNWHPAQVQNKPGWGEQERRSRWPLVVVALILRPLGGLSKFDKQIQEKRIHEKPNRYNLLTEHSVWRCTRRSRAETQERSQSSSLTSSFICAETNTRLLHNSCVRASPGTCLLHMRREFCYTRVVETFPLVK